MCPRAQCLVMGDYDHGDALGIEFFEQAYHFFAGRAVEVACRFVGQQYGRLHYGGAGDGNTLALATGKLVRAMGGAAFQPVFAQRLGDAVVALAGGNPGQHHRQCDVFCGSQARYQVKALEYKADALAAHAGLLIRIEGGDVAAFQPISAAIRPVQQAQQVEHGGFSRAGRPHDRHVFAGRNTEIDVAQRTHHAIAQRKGAIDAVEFDQAHA